MPPRSSRRELICEAALDLAAEGGNHALTHQGIDARLGLARGSTSYYYRTRVALVSAAIEHLTLRSRAEFAALPRTRRSMDEAAGGIAAYLDTLVADRRRDVLARYALMAEAAGDDALREGLASCLFSVPAATELMAALGAADPVAGARDLIALLEGLVLARAFASGGDTGAASGAPSVTIGRWLVALTSAR